MTTTDQCNTSSPPTLTEHINFDGLGVGPDGERFLRVDIDDGSEEGPVSTLLRIDNLASPQARPFDTLNRQNAHLISPPARSEFLRRIQDLGPQQPTFDVATRVGPFRDVFVLPDTIIGATEVDCEICLDDIPPGLLDWATTAGNATGWHELVSFAKGNSRFILSLGVMFSGPLNMILQTEPVAVQLLGEGGTGKSSVGIAASSVWGWRPNPDLADIYGSGDSWYTTGNNLDRVLAARNGTGLFLDETHLAPPLVVADGIFTIRGGQGKGRYNEDSRLSWFLPMVSTSNVSVADILSRAKRTVDRASLDRMSDVPLPEGDFGVFEDLHGFDSGAKLAVHIKALGAAHHGRVGRRYLLCILNSLADDPDELAAWVGERRDFFVERARERVGRNPDYQRVIGSFATLYAALCLAKAYGLLRLTHRDFAWALMKCLRDHLRVTGDAIARVAAASPDALLKAYVQQNRASFVELNSKPLPRGHVHAACPGYVHKAAGRTWFGFRAPMVERVLGGRGARDALCRQLDRLGLIRKTSGGRDGPRFVIKVKVGEEREYLQSFDPSLFA
jgi:putative DNA primase/helicase